MLQHLPDHLQEQSFLRIDQLRLARRDVEKGRVESLDVVDETAPFAVDPVLLRVRIEVLAIVEAVRWDLRDAIPSLSQHVPELPEVPCPGESSGGADDGDVPTLMDGGSRNMRPPAGP